jgi:protoheme IX farnesyltransferase
MTPRTASLEIAATRQRLADYVALTKPGLVAMVLVTTAVGFYLGSTAAVEAARLIETIIATSLAAGGTLALNQYLERDLDARMERTRHRPLPDGRLQPFEALLFGATLTCAGLLYLTLVIDPLSGLVTGTTVASYLFLYTPLKTRTALCTVAGAIPGALPPLCGWAAARGQLGLEAWVLFSILFLWQLPHSLAIAWLYRDDYARAGMPLLPVVDPDGSSTGRQVAANCLALLAVSMLPTFIGLAGRMYFVAATALGTSLLYFGVQLARRRTPDAARRLLLATLVYLPVLLAAMAIDKVSG